MSQQRIQSVSDLAVRVANDPELAERIKADPAATIANLAVPLQTDVWIYRIVVGALSSVILLAVIGAIALAFKDKGDTPQLLTALGSAAIGALAGLLAPSQASRS
jgi:hypothetical protein